MSNKNSEDFIDYFRYCYRQGVTDHVLTIVHVLYEERNHSLSDIAGFLGITKTTISSWLRKEYTPTRLPSTLPERKLQPYDLSELEKKNLENLAKLASKVSKNTPPDAPSRRAANQLILSVKDYIEIGTTITQIAKAANVSRRAIYQRLESYDRNNK